MSTPPPASAWDRLERFAGDVPGWSPVEELFSLFQLVYATAHIGGDVMELGAWCGRSACALSLGVRAAGGHVYSVDLFPRRDDWQRNGDGSYSLSCDVDGVATAAYRQQTVWQEPFERDILPVYDRYADVLEAYRDAIRRNGFGDVATPVRGTAAHFAEYARGAGISLRLAFVDGDHGYESVLADIASLEPLLLPGGYLAFDDAFTTYAGVDQAIREAILASGRYDCGQQMVRKLFVARKR